MKDGLDALVQRMQQLERELVRELQRKEREFFYEVREGRVRFREDVVAGHRKLVKRLHRYVLDSTLLVILTAPVIWACLVPIVLLDALSSLYQLVCFPVYGIPRVRRGEYVMFDRHRLSYLNAVEKLNCLYCGYANGVLAYVGELAARTEQYWCPIKHALKIKAMHSRYGHFLDYGDAEGYRRAIEQVRRDFADVEESPRADA